MLSIRSLEADLSISLEPLRLDNAASFKWNILEVLLNL